MESIKVYNEDNLPTIDYNQLEDLQGDLKTIKQTELNKLKKSIMKHGIFLPKFVWKNNGKYWTLDGHQTKKALTELADQYDIPNIPIAKIKAKSKKDAIEKLLIINSRYGKINRQTELLEIFDFKKIDKLVNEIEIPELNIELLLGEETIEDDELPKEVNSITQLGDLWELGRHRLLCGDTTKSEDIKKIMNNQCADMIFTDPPFGIMYLPETSKRKNMGYLKSDTKDRPIYKKFIYESMESMIGALKEGGVFYIFVGYTFMGDIIDNIYQFNCIPRNLLIWQKGPNLRKYIQDYIPDCEPFVYGWKRGKKRYLNFGNQEHASTTWKIHYTPSKKMQHPTQKPVELCKNGIINSSKKGEIVIDFFLGSGSTLIAAEITNRICYGIDLDVRYCDVIVNRYKNWCIANDKEYIIKRNGKKIDL